MTWTEKPNGPWFTGYEDLPDGTKIIKIHKRAINTFGYPFSKRLRYKELTLTEMSSKAAVGCWWYLESKRSSTPVIWAIWFTIRLHLLWILQGLKGRGENTEIDIPYLVQKKNNKNYLHPLLPPLHRKVDYPQFSRRLLLFLNGRCHHW